jgi:hypothetical protein
MASMTNVDRIEFAPFFSVAPVNGLMVAAHRKENYEKDDIIAEVINTNFGRTPELKLFGGFANGIDISVSEPKELNANQLKQVAENAKSSNQFEMIVERSDILVCTTSFPAEGHQYQCYVFITPKGILKSLVPLDIMSKAEADSYRKMFASALPMGASTDKQQTGKTSHQTQQEAAASALKAEGEQQESEGCLSIPGEWGITRRPAKVTVKALDRHGNEIIVEGEGLLARAFCHEIDHLDGKLFIDVVIEKED